MRLRKLLCFIRLYSSGLTCAVLPLLQPGKIDKRTGDPEAGGKTSGQKAVRLYHTRISTSTRIHPFRGMGNGQLVMLTIGVSVDWNPASAVSSCWSACSCTWSLGRCVFVNGWTSASIHPLQRIVGGF